MKRFILLLSFIITINYIGFSQNFKATVDRNTLEVGDRLTVTYSIDSDGSNFRPPKFSNLKLLMGPSQSQNVQIINGKVSRYFSFSYVLEAISPGKFTIPSAKITSNGKELTSNSVEITVLKPSQAKQEQMKREQEQNKSMEAQAKDLINQNLKIEVDVSKTTAYVGEPIVATYRIYLHPQLNILQLAPEKTPQLNGFWNQEIDIGKIEYNLQNIKGRTYQVAIIKKVILFPQQSGKLIIDSYDFNTVVRLQVQNQDRRRNNDPFNSFFDSFFDDFFNTSYKDFQTIVKSPSITINVKDLPATKIPSFTNAVGDFKISSWLDKTNAKTGEAVSYKIKIEGMGNLKLISAPTITLPPSIEVYEPKLIDNTQINGSNVVGNNTYEYILIPQATGKYKIPAVEFTYFNLEQKKYITISTDEQILNVQQGNSQSLSNTNKEDVQYLNQDIDFIKNEMGKRSQQPLLFSSIYFLLLLFPIILYILFILYRKKKQENESNISAYKQSKARKQAIKRLSNSRKLLQKGENDKFLEETTKAIWGFLSDKFIIEQAKLSRDNIEEVMKNNNLPEELIKSTILTLDNCEFKRFSQFDSSVSYLQIYSDAENVITKIEEILK